MSTSLAVYLEEGKKRTFAGALDWPGWCRRGRNESEALTAMFEYGPRYGPILSGTRLGFVAPKKLSQLTAVERLPGNATTDFGAPVYRQPSTACDRVTRPLVGASRRS